jgi:hypothetical protein
LKSLIDQFKQVSRDCDIIVVERSTESQRKVFVQEFLNTGVMGKLDLQIYEMFRDELWLPIEREFKSLGFCFKYVYIQTSV